MRARTRVCEKNKSKGNKESEGKNKSKGEKENEVENTTKRGWVRKRGIVRTESKDENKE